MGGVKTLLKIPGAGKTRGATTAFAFGIIFFPLNSNTPLSKKENTRGKKACNCEAERTRGSSHLQRPGGNPGAAPMAGRRETK